MGPDATAPQPPDRRDEFDRAFDHFRSLLDPAEIDAMQPMGPAAIYTALVTVWLLIYQRLYGGRPLSDAVDELLRIDPILLPENRRIRERTLSGNTGAYSQARKRLRPEVTDRLADNIFDSLIAAAPPSLDGRRAFLLDGTTIALASTAALKAAFPPASNQHGTGNWPVAHLLVAHELESGCAIRPEVGPMYGPSAVSEADLAMAILPRLPTGSIVLADRNFGIFSVAYAAVDAGHDVVFRLTGARFRALLRKATLLSQGDGYRTWSLKWTPSGRDRRSHPELPEDAEVTARLHEVIVSPERSLWLVTTLTCEAPIASGLYRRRLDVETDIRDVKVTLRTEQIEARCEEMVRKELVASIIAYNLVVQVRRLAAKATGVQPRRLSFRGVLGAVRIVLLEPMCTTAEGWRERFELALRIAGQRKIPERPGRSYPRRAIPRRNKSTSGSKRPPP